MILLKSHLRAPRQTLRRVSREEFRIDWRIKLGDKVRTMSTNPLSNFRLAASISSISSNQRINKILLAFSPIKKTSNPLAPKKSGPPTLLSHVAGTIKILYPKAKETAGHEQITKNTHKLWKPIVSHPVGGVTSLRSRSLETLIPFSFSTHRMNPSHASQFLPSLTH